jgi:poly [ADP-ribose] polymerase
MMMHLLNLLGSHHVYIDDESVIFDVALNQTNSSANNNKFYTIQLLENGDDYKVWTRWGRVAEKGQSALLGDGTLENALKEFKKKFKDKSGLSWDNRLDAPKPKKYVFLERNYEPDDSQKEAEEDKPKVEEADFEEVESKLSLPVQNLMKLIFNKAFMNEAMQSLDYDANKMPLGKLSKRTITQAYQALKVSSSFHLFLPKAESLTKPRTYLHF